MGKKISLISLISLVVVLFCGAVFVGGANLVYADGGGEGSDPTDPTDYGARGQINAPIEVSSYTGATLTNSYGQTVSYDPDTGMWGTVVGDSGGDGSSDPVPCEIAGTCLAPTCNISFSPNPIYQGQTTSLSWEFGPSVHSFGIGCTNEILPMLSGTVPPVEYSGTWPNLYAWIDQTCNMTVADASGNVGTCSTSPSLTVSPSFSCSAYFNPSSIDAGEVANFDWTSTVNVMRFGQDCYNLDLPPGSNYIANYQYDIPTPAKSGSTATLINTNLFTRVRCTSYALGENPWLGYWSWTKCNDADLNVNLCAIPPSYSCNLNDPCTKDNCEDTFNAYSCTKLNNCTGFSSAASNEDCRNHGATPCPDSVTCPPCQKEANWKEVRP